jgi:hypothetical protein
MKPPVGSVPPKFQVFISSTVVDLREERQAVTWEILKAGHIPVGMENFSAYDDRGWKVIERTLSTTDYYVLILAGRYGSIDEAIGMSWTEHEYRRALELGIPVLAFVRDKGSIRGDQLDMDSKATMLARLIDDVGRARLRETWTTTDDLRAKVAQALTKHIRDDEADGNARPGWYRGDHLPERRSPDHAYLSGLWVDAAYIPPRPARAKTRSNRGMLCFGSRCEFTFDSRTGSVTGKGDNYAYDGTSLGRYMAHSSKVGTLRLTYTFNWYRKERSFPSPDSVLGCGSLLLESPSSASATYEGSFFAEGIPKFNYMGRRLRPEEEAPERAPEVIARWMDAVSSKLKCPIATAEQLGKVL